MLAHISIAEGLINVLGERRDIITTMTPNDRGEFSKALGLDLFCWNLSTLVPL